MSEHTHIQVNGKTTPLERVRKMAALGDHHCQAALHRHEERTKNLALIPSFVEYQIAESQVPKFEKFMAKTCRLAVKINKRILEIRAKRVDELGSDNVAAIGASIPESRWSIGEPEVKEHGANLYLYRTARVSLPEIKFPGDYRLIATVDVNRSDESGTTNVVNRVRGYHGQLPDPAWTGKMCDHCKKKRNRKNMFVLENNKGEHFRVARTCSVEFFGVDGDQMLRALAAEASLREGDGSKWGHSREDQGVDHMDFLAVIIKGHRAHAQNAWNIARALPHHIAHRHNTESSKRFTDSLQPSEANYKAAREALAWVASQQWEDETLRSIQGACSFPLLLAKHAALVAQLPKFYVAMNPNPKVQTVDTPSRKLESLFLVKRAGFSQYRNANTYTLVVSNRAHQANKAHWVHEFKELVPRDARHYNPESRTWTIYLNPNTAEQRVREIRALLNRHLDPSSVVEQTNPTHTETAGVHAVSLPSRDVRFFSFCARNLDPLHVISIAHGVMVTKDLETARKAYKIALWCLSHPVEDEASQAA